MIFDVFMLGDELDMLEVRLAEYQDVPDLRHVIAEAPVTHTGIPKPLHYAENKARFSQWDDRIIHVPTGEIRGASAWARENAQRDHGARALSDADPDDRVLAADIDEFVPAAMLALEPPVCFETTLSMYAADWVYPGTHSSAVLVRAGSLTPHASLTAARDWRRSYPKAFGGRHLTWLGGPEAIRAKLDLTCHTEMPRWFRALLATGKPYYDGVHPDGTRMQAAEVDETWPRMIFERKCPASWFRPRP